MKKPTPKQEPDKTSENKVDLERLEVSKEDFDKVLRSMMGNDISNTTII